MKIRLFTLLLLIPFCGAFSQTVIKIPFSQPQKFVVEPQAIYKSIGDAPSIDLGLDVEINGGSGTYSYTWNLNNVVIGTEATQTITQAGIYILIVTDGQGCESTVTYNIDGGSGIENETAMGSLLIYPNPSDGQFFIRYPDTNKAEKVEIFDMQGRILKSITLTDTSADVEVNIKEILAGHYLVVSHFGNKKITKAIIKK